MHVDDRDDVNTPQHKAVTLVVDGRAVLLVLGEVGVVGILLAEEKRVHNKY
jgi:hypothetical protein